MVSDEDDLTSSANQRYKTRGLGCLSRLVEQDARESASVQEDVANADTGATEDLSAVENIVSHLSLDSAHLLPTTIQITVRQPLLLAFHSRDSAREFLVEFEMLFEVSPKWMSFHLSIDGGLA